MPRAANARATSVAAPSPTIRPTWLSGSAAAPHSTSRRLTESARSRRESISVPSRSKTNRSNACWVLGCDSSLCTILGERRGRFPDGHTHDRHAGIESLIEDQFGNPLHGGIAVHDV